MIKFFKQKNAGRKILSNAKGFTLVETLVAVSIFTVSILGLMAVLSQGISDTGYAKKKIVAGYLAQEGVELTRNMRDNYVLFNVSGSEVGWSDFKGAVVSETFPITDPNFSDFTRTVTADVASFGNNEIKIYSTVEWTQGSGTYSITLSENLYNWLE